jgi:alkylation response protein AidB-like acyl-CoA dehydrogenase
MDFTFSREQEDLRANVAAVVEDLAVQGVVRAAVEDEPGAADELWATMRGLGWPALLVPERCGGLGLGLVDAVVVLEETGRRTLPGPFLSSSVLATVAADALGEDELLGELASGAARGTVALEEGGSGGPVESVRTIARRKGSEWRLTGTKPVVLDAGADWAIVAALTQDGLGSFLVDMPAGASIPTLDPTRSTACLEMDGLAARALGPGGDHREMWHRLAGAAAVALSAELVGVCDAALAMAVAYGRQRVQFDVPISSHQVIQHAYVDMLHGVELGRVGVHYAAWAFDADDEHRAVSAAIAKSAMGAAAVFATAENIQVHGAVGFTWASDAHLLFKRAKQNDVLFGRRGFHDARVADAVIGT